MSKNLSTYSLFSLHWFLQWFFLFLVVEIWNASDSVVPSSIKTLHWFHAEDCPHPSHLRAQTSGHSMTWVLCSLQRSVVGLTWSASLQNTVNTCWLDITNSPAVTHQGFFFLYIILFLNFLKADSACCALPPPPTTFLLPFTSGPLSGFCVVFFFLFCQPFCCFSACAAVLLDWTRQLPPMPLQTMACQSRPKWCAQCGSEEGAREQSATAIWPQWVEQQSDH